MKPPRLPYADCNACPLSRYRNNGPAGYDGPANPEVIFIGEGLGAEEAQAKRPFVGASGKILRGVADRYGEGKYGITNIVACRPPNNETPDQATIYACALRLKAELDRFPNAKLVALGEVAVQALGVPHRLNEIDGCWSQVPSGPYQGRWVMSSYHPSKVMRETHSKTGNAARFPSFALAVRRAFDEPKELYTPTVPYTIISDASQLPDKEGMVVVDIETEGLDRWDRMTCLVLSWGPGKTYIVERDVIYAPEFREWFDDREGIAGHNLQFDLHRLCLQLGVTLPENIFDTMKAYHLINESGLVAFASKDFKDKKTKASFGLKTLLRRIFGIQYGFEGDWRVDLNDPVQRERLYDYAAVDGEYTYRLWQWLLEEMDETLLNLARTITFPLSAVLTEMEMGGVLFDREEAEKNAAHFDAQVKVCKKGEGDDGQFVKEIRTLLQKEFPKEDFANFNPNSFPQVQHVLYALYRLPVQTLYKAGETKVTSNADALKTLSTIAPTNPFLPLMLGFRPTSKLNGTYVSGPMKRVEADDYLHASFWALTETGRLSSLDPNLQNIPRGQTEDAKRIKMQYLPDLGHVFIEFDWSQAELRTLALFAQISAMITAFREGRDLHTEMTIKIFGSEYHTWDDKRKGLWRSIVKRINFGIPYGSEAKTVADVVWKEFSVKDRMAYPGGYPALLRLAEEIYAGWFKANPEYTIWSDNLLAEAFSKGYLETPFGRRRRIGFKPPTWGRPTPELIHLQNQLKNFLIQSVGSADMNSLGMIRCRERIKREGWRSLARLVLTVHDSVGFSASQDKAFLAEFIPAMRDEMLSVPVEYLGTEVPFKVDVKVGERWGSTKEITV